MSDSGGFDGHGAARHLTQSAINLGMAQQVMLDKPDLAANVTSVAVSGVPGWGGSPISIHTHGHLSDAQAWAKYLGPAAQVHEDSATHFTVTTLTFTVHVTDWTKAQADR